MPQEYSIVSRDEGIKHDADKLRFDLIPVDVQVVIADILTQGARKYGDKNWEKGIKYSRCLAAVSRHLAKWQLGEPCDAESGCHHVAHAIVNLMFILSYELRGMNNLDDVHVSHSIDEDKGKNVLDFLASE